MITKINAIRNDEHAVSPVIGVILMVAVTVVLAAVIGAFVFGIGDTLSDPAPNADIDFDYNADAGEVLVSHDGGDTITSENTGDLALNIDSDDAHIVEWNDDTGTYNDELLVDNTDGTATVDDSISSGDVIAMVGPDAADGVESGDTIEIIWNSPDGGSSTGLGDFEAP